MNRSGEAPAMSRLLGIALLLWLATASAARTGEPPVSTANRPSGARIAVLGSAEIEPGQRRAAFTWAYEVGGERVETRTTPVGLRVQRIASDAERMIVKFPNAVLGSKIGAEMHRTFDPPLQIDSDQPVICICSMREDCGGEKGFECQVEGYVAARPDEPDVVD